MAQQPLQDVSPPGHTTTGPGAGRAGPTETVSSFVALVKPYKELIVLIVSFLTAIFFITDYFATKQEVRVLKCKVDAGIGILENKMAADQLGRVLISLNHDLDAYEERKQTKIEALHQLKQRIQDTTKDRDAARNAQQIAENKLKSGDCEAGK